MISAYADEDRDGRRYDHSATTRPKWCRNEPEDALPGGPDLAAEGSGLVIGHWRRESINLDKGEAGGVFFF